ncbi:SpoIIE family protein phosphatase [Irregularibacter muris]|uniref:SpoIIE family protein phosphatase n=1 Tax=Irregularibacter muris TaxID=1796619 RepID=A0AAE3HDW5_9FIRM|nr:MASE3 domain-containing protein [Irregularibacter muris]MCR1897594.1 SpoIIE family protein phosphatase [Irregularibacter muris]
MNAKIENAPKGLISGRNMDFSAYRLIIISFFSSAVIFYFVRFLENKFYKVYVQEHFLVLHTVAEFASIIMYIASFLVIYYVGNRDRRLRMKVLAGILLFVGCVDFWHTFSYKGMPGLLVPSSVQAATAYWIIGRLGLSIGILTSSFIPIKRKVEKISNWLMVGLPLLLSLGFLLYLSFFPKGFPLLFIEGQGLTPIKIILEYIIIAMLLIAFIRFAIEFNKKKDFLLSLFLSALILTIFSELAFVSYSNVYDIYNLLGHIYKLISAYMIFKVLFIFNIHHPYNRLDRAEKEISKYANNLEQLVELRTQEIHEANTEMLRDLEYAKTIQKAIMSEKHEIYDSLEVFSEYIPYEKVGGDYYGFEDLNDENVAFYIGDVAGHGIPAAMMTIFMKQTIVSSKPYHYGLEKMFSPKEVLTNLYRKYNETDFPLEMYALMLYGIYEKRTKKLVFSSAGLNTYPLIFRKNGMVEVVEHTGFPICKIDANYDPQFKDYHLVLDEGDKVLFYTDGLVEIADRKGQPFGEERIIDIMEKNGSLSPELLSHEILKNLEAFTKGVKLNDDVHYFIMEAK